MLGKASRRPAMKAVPDDPLQRVLALAGRHPTLALGLFERLAARAEADDNAALAIDSLCGRFLVLERLGQATQLMVPLTAALERCKLGHLPRQAAQCHEALGRIHYQLGEYQDASLHWSQAVDLAGLAADTRSAVAARIGLAQIHYALGDWVAGQRFLDDAAQLLQELDDAYLRAKLALNQGVGWLQRQALEAAAQQFRLGLAAAQRAGHREYEAEALWQLARVALGRGEAQQAERLARQALALAEQVSHHWLQSMALQTLTELAQGQGALEQAHHLAHRALALALQLGAREQQANAHRQLAALEQALARPDAALRHLWAALDLQAELQRLSLPERVSVLARFDPANQGPEELLLNLSNRDWNPANVAQLQLALAELGDQTLAIMGLDRLQFWWDEDGSGRFRRFPAPSDGPALLRPLHGQYLDLLAQAQEPLALADLRLHPCHALLALVDRGTQAASRIEIALRLHGHVVALLWLEQREQTRAWTRHDLLHASHIGRIYERLLMGLDLVTAMGARTAMEQEKLSAQARLVASIAHDVNTPIGIAVTAASGLEDAAQRLSQCLRAERVSRAELLQLSATLSQAAQLVQGNLQRAAELIGGFKRMAVDQASEQVVRLQLADYVRQLVAVHSPALTKAGIRCVQQIPAELQLELVAGQLSQALSNLIMNSLAHAFPDGRPGCISISARAEGGEVLIEVADDGIGLSPEVRAHVFEPFFTTKRGRGGSGLGLHIVQTSLQALGGSVELPAATRGLTVRLRLPLQPAQLRDGAPSARSTATARPAGSTAPAASAAASSPGRKSAS
jgi:signal transduction histidine kinase